MSADPAKIYQDFLDRTGDALLANDAAAFLDRIVLPHRIMTETETILIEDAATARRHFFGFAAALRSQGVDVYVRTVKRAERVAPDRIIGWHETFITSSGKLVAPRFENQVELIHRDGRWGSIWTRHFTRFVAWPDILPREGR
ncbi:hypothetical protein N0B44_12470 [Roseibacterium beibuensis]|uniref:SnoaL-like domain-containing protein n=1 Tax=[Roseibacterium] beibuensis TaxID=1193142 RepID=A0ABP9L7D8_9RHOB|nr:hypothetical protein [Roseibacterium beibuensis]MCS6623728.1 hypothetical protein [Roseibacterium beibuensis]